MVPWLWPRAAYIHVPFCAHHCNYCDFAVVERQEHMIDLYLEALAVEMSSLGEPQRVDSIFIGGGTPTHLNPAQLQRLLGDIQRWLLLTPGGEFSVEANPSGLHADKIAVLSEHGVTRVSLGAQSFQPGSLRALERDHQPADVARAIEHVKRRIAEVSVDLIFGVPGQSLSEWSADLDQAVRQETDHISTYGLTYEKGTRLWKDRERGAIAPVDEDTELAMYVQAIERLEAAGFEHYEISNHARPGKRSRHNEVYWANHAYFGFGMGAARYVEFRREMNRRDLRGYIGKVLAGEPATFQSEILEPEARARETIAVQLRRSDGIARRQFHEQTGYELDALAADAVARHVHLGLLVDDTDGIRLTRQGKCVADAMIRDYL